MKMNNKIEFMVNSIITLTTDFGLRDPYVAEMKAVILGINPHVTIIDITHEVEKFNIRMGGYVLASAAPYFPKGTVHVVVVDPGVGSKRKAIIVEGERSFFVGPDNGVLILAAEREGIKNIYCIENRRFMLPKVSETFHGRDIFAPVAAYLTKGVQPIEFGSKIYKVVKPRFAKVIKRGNSLVGEVIHIDDFGNIVTNFSGKDVKQFRIGEFLQFKVKGSTLKLKFCKAYADVKKNEPLAIIGSHDFLEISVNQGNAAQHFGIEIGEKITLTSSIYKKPS